MLHDLSIQWQPVAPLWAVALLVLALLAALGWGSLLIRRRQVPLRWVVVLAVLRLAAVAVFLAALLRPSLTFTQVVEPTPELTVLVDVSQSMALPGAAGGGSRLHESLKTVRTGPLADALRTRFQVRFFAFDGDAYPVDEAGLAALQPTGANTDYGKSLADADALGRTVRGSPRRILLVSDGHDRGADDPAAVAQRLGVTIDALAPGSPDATVDDGPVTVADVQAPRRVFLGSETAFRVALRGSAVAVDRPLTVRLTEDGKEVWRKEVVFKQGVAEQRVDAVHRPTSAGVKHYTFQLDGAKDEPYRLSVQVVDGKSEVLVLEDTWRWEFKFLRRVLEDDPGVRYTAFLSRGGAQVQFGSPDRRINLAGFPQGSGDLTGFDTLILGDVDPSRWPRGLAAAVSRAVTEEGKSLVVIAGPNLSKLAASPELDPLLPVEVAARSAAPVDGPVDVRLTADGRQSPIFSGAPGMEADANRLPPLDQVYAPVRKRPGAAVLVEAARKANAYGNLIVMAEQPVGRGRCLFIGADTLWKWHTLAPPAATGVSPYTTFWQQTLRSLTPDRSGLGDVRLWVQPDRTRAEVGRPLVLRAEVEASRSLPLPVVSATVVLPDGSRQPLAFTVDANEPTRFRAELTPPQSGPYQILASVVSEGKTAAETTALVDATADAGETSAVGVNRANLARIATATGGRVVDPTQPETWPTPAESDRERVVQTRQVELWGGYSLVLLCVLLGLDWTIRLLRGYV